MDLIDADTIVEFLRSREISHLVWIPDSTLGKWDQAITDSGIVEVVRPCREGEAIGIAAGLWLGGARPVVAIQCTVFFEAGDALRNAVHDLKLPLFILVGCRSYFASKEGSHDTATVFAEPVLKAWQVPYTVIESTEEAEQIGEIYDATLQGNECRVVLLAE